MRPRRCLRYAIHSASTVHVADDKKKMQRLKKEREREGNRKRLVQSLSESRAESLEPRTRGRRSLIRTLVRSLSRLTKPHLALSYLTSFAAVPVERSSVSHPRNPSARSLTRSRACTPVRSPNSTFPRCYSVPTIPPTRTVSKKEKKIEDKIVVRHLDEVQ